MNMTRRSFLAGLAALTGATALDPLALRAEEPSVSGSVPLGWISLDGYQFALQDCEITYWTGYDDAINRGQWAIRCVFDRDAFYGLSELSFQRGTHQMVVRTGDYECRGDVGMSNVQRDGSTYMSNFYGSVPSGWVSPRLSPGPSYFADFDRCSVTLHGMDLDMKRIV